MKKITYLKNSRCLAVFIFAVFLILVGKTKLQAQQQKNLPNIVYILADDLGYGDIKIYNANAKVNTPHIDKLANQGMRFSDAHTTSSVCTPSRYSILTGRYPWRSRLAVGVLRGYSRALIEEGLPTVASLLRTKSYRTAVVGKWHLGLDWVPKAAFKDSISPAFNKDNLYGITDEMNPDQIDFTKAPTHGPRTQGFDYSYVLPASLDMPPYCYLENDQLTAPLTGYTPGSKLESGYTGPFWRAGLKSPSFDFYKVLPTFTNKAADFIKKQAAAKNPFFLYFPMPAPHTPWLPSAEYIGKSQAGDYGDYIQEVDAAVGKILQVLDSLGLSKNTMVVFTSDNGPYWRDDFIQKYDHHAAGPFRGMKGDAFEGGHRVPFIVRYPGKVKPGSVTDVSTTLANLMATCADLTGDHSTKFETEDSYSILPVLFGKSDKIAEQPAIVNISSKGFYDIRKGPWKLITDLGSGGFSAPSKIKVQDGQPAGQLYNLETDVKEEKNLYNQYPGKVKELNDLLEKIKAAPKGKPFTGVLPAQSQKTTYVPKFANENHEQIGYWFITPTLIGDLNKALANIDSIATKCNYTMLFLTAREGANFFDLELLHPFFKQLVAEGHRKGLKVGLQLWGNYQDKTMEGSQRMIIENEVTLNETGSASFIAKAKYIRFADRLLKSDLFKVYAFKKTGEGFYDPATLKEITSQCDVVLSDKESLRVTINGGAALRGLTACIMTQQYCSQSSMWDDVEINGFTAAMRSFADIPFDGFALDEYGNKFIERIFDQQTAHPFRGRWYSTAMAKAYTTETGDDLGKTLFNGRYAPEGKPEVRIKAINEYMEFMRKGALRVETAVFHKSREIFGKNIFSGIHNTYHNSLINDEIWANGIAWWSAPRAYGQTDEKTFLPTQMGVAMSHPMNAMYNQYYDAELSPVVVKAIHDLRYGIRTHYHALNDKRPLRFDLEFPEAIDSINKIENCARLLNKFNSSLPEVKLLVIFGMEALSNWYPNYADRGVYDINDKLGIESKAVEIWNAGYLNALVPSDLIVNHTLTIGKDGKPVMNGHKFDAVLFLNPQYAREPVLKFLETYQKQGGKLMIEGRADRDFKGNLISARFKSIYDQATVVGYRIDGLSKLGLTKNLLPDGCKNEDGSYVFTDLNSLRTDQPAGFSVHINDDRYTGEYKGLAVLAADKNTGVRKFAAAGCKSLSRNGQVILSFSKPVDFYMEKKNGTTQITIADETKSVEPLINKL